jgi:hypothetical protein
MLGKAQAVANEPYRVYQGPMTAGESGLQSKVFQGLGGLNFPSNLGQSFSSPMGGQQPQTMPAYRGQQPYPAQIPGTGGGMLTLYSGGRPTDVMGGDYTGGKGFSPGQPARYDEGTGGGMAMPYKSNMSELLGSLGMGGAGAKPTGMPMQEAMPDYASMGMAGLASVLRLQKLIGINLPVKLDLLPKQTWKNQRLTFWLEVKVDPVAVC